MINIVAAIVCIAAMTGLDVVPEPHVHVGAQSGWAAEWPNSVELYYPPGATVDGKGIVWVAEGYEHMVVHGLVHHLQHMNGRDMYSAGAELLAREIQWRFWPECPEAQGGAP